MQMPEVTSRNSKIHLMRNNKNSTERVVRGRLFRALKQSWAVNLDSELN